MDKMRTGVFMLFVLVVPVSCSEIFFTDQVICYFLDGFLMIYCIVATALYFREKFSHLPAEVLAASTQDDKGAIYQELERPKDADPYQVLEPLKKKKRPGKKKKSQADERGDDRDRYESVDPSSAAPPVAPV